MKRISTEAYQALREALAVVTWNKRPFESLVRTALRDSPQLLSGLNFNEPKRQVADQLVDRLTSDERLHQEITLQLMLEVAGMTRFPNIEQIKDEDDRKLQLARARAAVAHLNALTKSFAAETAEREKLSVQREATRLKSEATRRFGDEIEELRKSFIELQKQEDKHQRGYALESLLNELFRLFDMEPRLAYKLKLEQIDGSLNFDTDDYIVEARWRKALFSRGDADIFATKVRRKGKNALGLVVSIDGFTRTALEQYREATPFITMDGGDVYLILEQRIRLDDLMKAKRRHANETGSCYLPAKALMGGF